LIGFILLSAMVAVGNAQTAPIVLWESGAPNAVGKEPQDIPTITPFLAPKEIATGAAVLVLPGGGYSHLSEVKEGSDVAKWLNSLGVTAFVLKYRLGMRYHQPNQLLDAARAMRTVRARAKDWGVDPNRIAILGFSAGGHLVAAISTNYKKRLYPAVDAADKESCRPDFAVALYPGHLAVPERGFALNPDIRVTRQTPPTNTTSPLWSRMSVGLLPCSL